MKKLILFLLFLTSSFLSLSFFPQKALARPDDEPKNPHCLQFKGRFTASDWPGGQVKVWCEGDNGENCRGDSQLVSPNETFNLTTCSCPEGGADGCLHVDQTQACVFTVDLGNGDTYCGGNRDTKIVDFGLACTPPPPTPACAEKCDENRGCTEAKDGCTDCRDSGLGFKTCQPPVSSPPGNTTPPKTGTPVTPPANTPPNNTPSNPPSSPPDNNKCNTSCNPGNKDRDCEGAKDNCTYCNPTSKKCETKPPNYTPAPPTPPAACNTPCNPGNSDRDCQGAKDGCTVCSNTDKKCVPAPTPTPVFNENWCECDELVANPAKFFPGDTVNFTAFGKVEGQYLDKAKVESFNFIAYRGGTRETKETSMPFSSGAIPAALDSTTSGSGKNRYKSNWTYQVPSDIKPGETFRIQAKPKCVAQNRNTSAFNFQPSLIDRVVSLIGYVFGLTPPPVATDHIAQAPVVSTPARQVLAAGDSLQIKTFTQSDIFEKQCGMIRFTFGAR